MWSQRGKPSRQRHRFLLMLGAISITLLFCSMSKDIPLLPTPEYHQQPSPTPQPTLHADHIPLEYARLYQDLQSKMDDYQSQLLQEWDGSKFPKLLYAAGFTLADGSRGPELWKRTTKQEYLLTLDRFQQMGIQGVSIHLPYPILAPDFPESAEFLAHYNWLFKEVHSRNLTIHINNLPLAKPEISGLRTSYYYAQLPDWETYLAGRSAMALLIAYELKPDSITFAMDPSQEELIVDPDQHLATQPYLATDRYPVFVKSVAQIIKKSGVQVGARISAWDDSQAAQRLATHPQLDFLDLHIFPILGNKLETTLNQILLASRANKKIMVSEAWLYKASSQEVMQPGGAFREANGRNVYSFWYPLDQQFHELLVQTAHHNHFTLISPSWTRHYFAYLDYQNQLSDLEVKTLIERCDELSILKLKTGEFTPTAQRYQELIGNTIR